MTAVTSRPEALAPAPAPPRPILVGAGLRVLMVTSEWPTPGAPRTSNFIKRQADFLQAAGVALDVVAFEGRHRPSYYARAWSEVRRRIAANRYDLIHAQFGHSGLMALPKRLPLVVTFRGSDILGIVGEQGRYTWRGKLLQSLSRLVARRADAVIVVSDHMRETFTTPAPIHVIPSGLDLELFRPMPCDDARRELGFDPAERIVLFVGRTNQPRKRYDLAERAVQLLNESLPASRRARLVVAWGVPHAKIPVYMSAANTLVLTSIHEGSPNVVKEALACDLPVVSVNVGDVGERLRGVEGCELCADDAPATIAAALARVLVRGGRVAGRAAVSQLEETILTERVVGIYRTVLQRN